MKLDANVVRKLRRMARYSDDYHQEDSDTVQKAIDRIDELEELRDRLSGPLLRLAKIIEENVHVCDLPTGLLKAVANVLDDAEKDRKPQGV